MALWRGGVSLSGTNVYEEQVLLKVSTDVVTVTLSSGRLGCY